MRNRICTHIDCKKQPSYNLEGQTKGIFCNEHKKSNMIDVKSPTCNHPDCKKKPEL